VTPAPDLEGIRGVLSRATGNGWEAAYRQDVGALLAEVERLRAEREGWRKAGADLKDCADRALDAAAAMGRERDAARAEVALYERDRAGVGSGFAIDLSDACAVREQCYEIIGAPTGEPIGVTHGEAGKESVLAEEPPETRFRAITPEECSICSGRDED
jgi:hypothetical protein